MNGSRRLPGLVFRLAERYLVFKLAGLVFKLAGLVFKLAGLVFKLAERNHI